MKLTKLLLIGLILISLAGCGGNVSGSSASDAPASATSNASATEYAVSEYPGFGNVFIHIAPSDFEKLGFELGDSVNLEFSNGAKFLDIPYYNGYYAKAGNVALVSYPGTQYLIAAICNGGSLWQEASVDENTTAKISLAEKKKYLIIQNALDIYEFQNKKAPDERAVFREVKEGNLKEKTLYRGLSPLDVKNIGKSEKTVDDLIEEAGIKFIINLADTKEEATEKIESGQTDISYYKKLFDDGKVANIRLDMNYKSDAFADKVVEVLKAISENEGPYYIHCTEGKDRSGFVCMIIDCLAAANYDEICDDYMKSYEYNFNITKDKTPDKYDVIKGETLDDMLRYIAGPDLESIPLDGIDFVNVAGRYCDSHGMTDSDFDALYTKLTRD